MVMNRYDEALAALQTAAKVAKTPNQAALVQNRISQVSSIQQSRAPASRVSDSQVVTAADIPGTGATVQTVQIVENRPANSTPKHPDEASGPKHSLSGIIQSVKCSYPTGIEFELKSSTNTITLYNNDFMKIDLSAIGFTPSGSMNPDRKSVV